MKKFFALLSLVIPSMVYPQSWEFVALSNSGAFYFVDSASIRNQDSEVRFTQLSNHPNGFQYDSKVVYSIMTFRSTDCKQGKYKSGFLFGYPALNAQGGIEIIDLKHDTKWILVAPESMASFMQDRVCNK